MIYLHNMPCMLTNISELHCNIFVMLLLVTLLQFMITDKAYLLARQAQRAKGTGKNSTSRASSNSSW